MSSASMVRSRSGCEKNGFVYSCGDLKIEPMPAEDTLARIYFRLKEENTWDQVFYEYDPTLSQFIKAFSDPQRAPLGCYGPDISGMIWLNRQETLRGDYRRGDTAMAFFRGQSIERLEAFTRMAIEWAFDHLKLDVIVGSTPAPNRAAVLFSKRMGFHVFGPIKDATVWNGKPCDVYMSSLSRDEWRF